MKFYMKLFLLILLISVTSVITLYFISKPKKPRAQFGVTPPTLSNIQPKISNSVACLSNTSIAAVLAVISHAGNQMARHSMRSAYPPAELDRLRMKRVFVLGTLDGGHESDKSYSSIQQREIIEENNRYSDIVQYRLKEGYNKLTYKSLLALKWATENCNQAKIIIKMDDDVLIDLYQMSELIDSLSIEDADKLTGCSASDRGINFLLGLLYMTSPKTAQLLLKTSEKVIFHSHEDIYVTGMLASSGNVKFNYIDNVFTHKRCLRCCTEISSNTRYLCGYIVGQRKDHGGGGDYSLIERVQKHSVYCYLSQTCGRFPLWKYVLGKYVMSNYISCIPEQCISVL